LNLLLPHETVIIIVWSGIGGAASTGNGAARLTGGKTTATRGTGGLTWEMLETEGRTMAQATLFDLSGVLREEE
jgi:hypothetical protein